MTDEFLAGVKRRFAAQVSRFGTTCKVSPKDAAGLAVQSAVALVLVLCTAKADPLLTYPVTIGPHTLRVEVANTEESRRQGLMFRRTLGENRGMLFVYDRPGPAAMWMRNTYVPLSVAFIDSTGRILNIERMVPLTDTSHASHGHAMYALEVNQGWFAQRGIKAGDKVRGLDSIPPAH